MNLCHCTRALAVPLRALFAVVLGPLAKRGIAECSQLSYLYMVAMNSINKLPKKIIMTPICNFNLIYFTVL